MKYLLDTNICIYALKLEGQVVERLRAHSPDDLGVSIITVAELWFGARKSKRSESNRRAIDAFLKPFEILPFDHAAAEAYAELRLVLERAGRPIGERDLQIASIATARHIGVVTHNVSEFRRVRGLEIVEWAE